MSCGSAAQSVQQAVTACELTSGLHPRNPMVRPCSIQQIDDWPGVEGNRQELSVVKVGYITLPAHWQPSAARPLSSLYILCELNDGSHMTWRRELQNAGVEFGSAMALRNTCAVRGRGAWVSASMTSCYTVPARASLHGGYFLLLPLSPMLSLQMTVVLQIVSPINGWSTILSGL